MYSQAGWLASWLRRGWDEGMGRYHSCVVGWLAGWLAGWAVSMWMVVVGHPSDRYSVVTGGIVIAQVRLVV